MNENKYSLARLAKARQVHEHIPYIYSGLCPVFLGLRKKLSENIQQRTNRWTEITPPYAEPYSLIVWVIQELFYLCRATEEACSSILYWLWLLLLRTSQHTGENPGIKKKFLALIQGWISSSPFPALQSQVSSNLHLFARGRPHIPPNWYLTNYISLIKDPIFNSIWIYLPVSTEFLCNLNQIISTQKFCNQGRWKIRPGDGEIFPGQVQVCSIPWVDGKDLIYLTCLCLCIFLCLYDCLLVGTGQLKIILDRFNCVPSLSLVEWIECI